MHTVKITKKGNAWFNTGHPWIYKDDCLEKNISVPPGEIVNVLSESSKFLAKAFYNPKSQIALRVITKEDVEIDRGFWAQCIKDAADYRKSVVKDTNAYRLIFSESDGLPGLVADIYDETIVLQISALGMERLKDEIKDVIQELFNPKAIICRNDLPVRKFEGLEEEKSVLLGKKPDLIEVFEGDAKYLVDIWAGHKTGAYLDQRENRFIAEMFAKGRVLDAFCYQGGFSLHLAKKAKEVLAIDSSQAALDIMEKNLELNNIKNVKFISANAFDKLKEFSKTGEFFDFIVLDPPPFAKSKKELSGAKRGYKELNLRAIKCLKKGGHLMTYSCSSNFSEEELLHSIRTAAADAKKSLRLKAKLVQSADHPISITMPESCYLKGFILEAQG